MSLRKLILSLLFAGLLLAVYAYAQDASAGMLAGLLALLLAAVIALEVFVRRPLLELTEVATALARKSFQRAPSIQRSGELGELATSLGAIRELLNDYDGELTRVSSEIRESRSLLQESEERYGLAVRGANDGLLEWDFKTGRTYFSPRWKGMLGFAEAEIGEQIDEWRDRIHPADRSRVLDELQAHLDGGSSPRFENEHRLRHKDGSWRWVLARGCALRNASGKAYCMLGLHTDITARKRIEGALLDIADGFTATSGTETFNVLTRNFASVLGVREAIVCECMNFPTTRVRMLAYWVDGGFAQPKNSISPALRANKLSTTARSSTFRRVSANVIRSKRD